MNIHELAVRVSKREGGQQNLSIAQIKEVIKCTFIEMYSFSDAEVLDAIARTSEKYDRI